MRRIFLIVTVLLSIVSYGQAGKRQVKQLNNPLDKHAEFELYIRQALQLWKTPGLSVAVVKDHQLVLPN